MLKSCFNRVAVEFSEAALHPCFDPVRRFILDGNGEMSDFVGWIRTPDRLAVPRLGPIDQFLGIVTRGSCVQGVVQFFGDILHSFRLTGSYSGPAIRCGYLVDPTRQADPAENRSPEFDVIAIPAFAEQSPENNEQVQSAFVERLGRIVSRFYERADARMVKETLEEALGPHAGEPFTEELASRLAQAFAERVLRLPRPSI